MKYVLDIDEMRFQMRMLRTGECLFTFLIFIAVLLYFPDRPPSPPSLSSALPKLDVRNALRQLFAYDFFSTKTF